MKTKVCSVVLIVALVFSLCLSVGAADDEGISPLYDAVVRCTPTITFSGKTATCTASITAVESTATITATLTLYKIESNGLLTWVTDWKNLTGTGRLNTMKTYTVASGKCNYRLTISGTVKDSSGTSPIDAYRDVYCSAT